MFVKVLRKIFKTYIEADPNPQTSPNNSLMLALEPRFLYDGAGLIAGIEGLGESSEPITPTPQPESFEPETFTPEPELPGETDPQTQETTEVVVASDDDQQSLKDNESALKYPSDPGQEIDIVPIPDALEQISESTATSDQDLNDGPQVLLISSSIEQADVLAEVTADGVITVIYDGSGDDPDTILDSITEVLDGEQASSIALATHDLGAGKFHLTGEFTVSPSTLLATPELEHFWNGIGELIQEGGRIDLLTCDLASTTDGTLLISLLKDITGRDVAASDDLTGNAAYGGDWILETHNVDAAALYFDADTLATFTGTLAGETQLEAFDTGAYDYFGYSVAIDGDYAIVGAYKDDDMGPNSGSVYIFEWDGTDWLQEQKLVASDGAENDCFGYSVAIDSDYAIVGAYQDDDNGEYSGSAYIFERDIYGYWAQEAKLTANDGAADDYFGYSVSIDGDYAIVGAYKNDASRTDAGSAYIFERNGDLWEQEAQLNSSDASQYDYFGYSVSISGDYAIVGANYDDDSGNMSGSAYIFERSGDAWDQEDKLIASDGETYDFFGRSVSIDGDYAIVGSYRDDDMGSASGSAYIFERNGDQWNEEAKLTAADGEASDYFGWSVAIDGDYAIVGAYMDDDMGSASGSAYVFERNGDVWNEEAKLTAADGEASDYLGYSAALSGDRAFIGAYKSDDGQSNSGAAYMFEWNGSSWDAQSKFEAAEMDPDRDEFGYSVSIDVQSSYSAYAVVGAKYASGVDWRSGAAYTYKWDAANSEWDPYMKLVASDGETYDYFGESVHISDDYVIVGARGDDDNDIGFSCGAAYIFDVSSSSYYTTYKLTASDAETQDYFGKSVSIDGDYAIVGAYGDDDMGTYSGSAYIFEWDGTDWGEAAKLTAADDGASYDYFGQSISIDGDHAIVGAYGNDDNGYNSGSAYIFKRDSSGNWIQEAKLTPAEEYDSFGYSVSIAGDYAIVGARYNDNDNGTNAGAAYMFYRDGDEWTQQATLTASDGEAAHYFGSSVSIDGDYAIVGADGDDDNGTNAGAAYIFQRDSKTWIQTEKILSSDGASSDDFGSAVGIVDGHAIVGAPDADTNGSTSGTAYIFDDLNEAPEAVNNSGSSFTTDEDTSFTTSDVLANDSDPDLGDTISLVSYDDSTITAGTLSYNNDGTFDFNPNREFESLADGSSATEYFTYTIEDNDGARDTATVTITITGVNDAASITGTATGSLTEDDTTTLTSGTLTITDPDTGEDVFLTPADLSGTYGAFTFNDSTGGWTYIIDNSDPDTDRLAAGQSVSDTLNITSADSSVNQDIVVSITGANDNPVLSVDADGNATEDTTSPNLTDNGSISFTDVDSTDTHFVSNIYQSDALWSGGILTTAQITALTNGFNTDSDSWNYTVANDDVQFLAAGETVTFSYAITVTDNNGGTDSKDVTITITGVNDNPALTVDTAGNVTEDNATPNLTDNGGLSFTDMDSNDTHTVNNAYQSDALWSGGTLTTSQITALTSGFSADTDSWNYTVTNDDVQFLAAGETVTFNYAITVTDNNGGTDTKNVTITVTGINDAPDAVDNTGIGFTTDENNSFTTTNVLADDSDPDTTDLLTVASMDTTGTKGLVTDNGDGTFDYDPNGQFTGLAVGELVTDTFSYSVSDGNGGTDTAVVTITITGVNNTPQAIDDSGTSYQTNEDNSFVTGNVLANDKDQDTSDTLSITNINTSATKGLVTINDDGTFTYNPNGQFEYLSQGETTTDSFTYTISDSNGGTSTAAVTITITGVNEPVIFSQPKAQGFSGRPSFHNNPFLSGGTSSNIPSGSTGSPYSPGPGSLIGSMLNGGTTSSFGAIGSGSGYVSSVAPDDAQPYTPSNSDNSAPESGFFMGDEEVSDDDNESQEPSNQDGDDEQNQASNADDDESRKKKLLEEEENAHSDDSPKSDSAKTSHYQRAAEPMLFPEGFLAEIQQAAGQFESQRLALLCAVQDIVKGSQLTAES